MLQTFFEIGCKKELFEGLKISDEKELCDGYMGQFPTVSITLKGVSGTTFIDARNALCDVIGNEAMRFQFLGDSEKLTKYEKELYSQLIAKNNPETNNYYKQAIYAMSDAQTKEDIERLISGESVVKTINMELTYNELDDDIENLWSVLYRQRGRYGNGIKKTTSGH